MPRSRDGRDRRAAIGARVQQLNPFEARAARDDLGRAEADQHVGARDDLGHARVVAQARARRRPRRRARARAECRRAARRRRRFSSASASRRSRARVRRLRAARNARRARPRRRKGCRNRRRSRFARPQALAPSSTAANRKRSASNAATGGVLRLKAREYAPADARTEAGRARLVQYPTLPPQSVCTVPPSANGTWPPCGCRRSSCRRP